MVKIVLVYFALFITTIFISLILVRKLLKDTYMRVSVWAILFISIVLNFAIDWLYGIYWLVFNFIVCIIALIFVVEYYKKALRIIPLCIIVLLMIYCTIVFIDMECVSALKNPVFASYSHTSEGFINIYKGIGYRIEMTKLSGTMYYNLFNRILSGVII